MYTILRTLLYLAVGQPFPLELHFLSRRTHLASPSAKVLLLCTLVMVWYPLVSTVNGILSLMFIFFYVLSLP